jgi:GNAT superfamily N-acetyltransferase
VFTGAGTPVNAAIGLGLRRPVSTAALQQIEAFYQQRGTPAQIALCPHADPLLLPVLRERGYGIQRFYTIHARVIQPHKQWQKSPGIVVEQLQPDREAQWIATVTGSFADTMPPDAVAILLARLAFHKPGAACFVAYVDGELAGAGALFIHQKVAMLFSAGTRGSFRRRGVQTALIAARLAAAARAGCNLAMTLSVPGGASERNLQRAGFNIAYTRPTLIKS